MLVPPKPFMLQCPACGWKRVHRPASRPAGNVFWHGQTSGMLPHSPVCARCGHRSVKTRRLTALEKAMDAALHPFRS